MAVSMGKVPAGIQVHRAAVLRNDRLYSPHIIEVARLPLYMAERISSTACRSCDNASSDGPLPEEGTFRSTSGRRGSRIEFNCPRNSLRRRPLKVANSLDMTQVA